MQKNRFSIFQKYPQLIATVSQKSDGSMKVYPDANDEGVARNRHRFLVSLGANPNRTAAGYLAHGNKIALIEQAPDSEIFFPETDGLCTEQKGIFLAVTVADCLPIFFFDPWRQAILLVHAGWAGISKGIIENAVKTLEEKGSSSDDILVAVGPGLAACHYEVQQDFRNNFPADPEMFIKRNGKLFFDIKALAKKRLLASGISEKNIEISSQCTYCEEGTFFSYRRDIYGTQKKLQAMIAVIGMLD